MVAQAIQTGHTVEEVDKLLRLWGFTFKAQGRDHRELVYRTGRTITLKRKSNSYVNIHVINEIVKILGITSQEFFDGPKFVEPLAVEQPVSDGNTVPSDPAPQEAEPAPEPAPEKPFDRKTQCTAARTKVVQYLAAQPGLSVKDPNGRVTLPMAQALGYVNKTTGLSSLLLAMERDQQIVRALNGKRCYEIMLVEDGPGVPYMRHRTDVLVTVPKTVPKTPEPQAPVAESVPPESVPPAPVSTEQLAAAIATQVLEQPEPFDYKKLANAVVDELLNRLSRPSREEALKEALADSRDKLKRSIEYNSRLRKTLQDLEHQTRQASHKASPNPGNKNGK